MVSPVRGDSACAIVGEDKVSESTWIRSISEGRHFPSGLADSESLDAFSIFVDDVSDLSSHDNICCESLVDVRDASYFGSESPLDIDSEVGCCEGCPPNRDSSGEFGKGQSLGVVINHSIRDELCGSNCQHTLGGCPVQLNRCGFYRELYLSGEQDPMADFLFYGICHGFDIIDPGCMAQYFCGNYKSIEVQEFRLQMDKIVSDELGTGKISMVETPPGCVHSLGAVRKSNGKLGPITDCRRPLGDSINNFMRFTYAPFHYIRLKKEL